MCSGQVGSCSQWQEVRVWQGAKGCQEGKEVVCSSCVWRSADACKECNKKEAYMATKKAIYRCPVFGMVGSECPTRRNAGYGAYTPCEDGLVTACLEEQDRSDMAADERESIRQDHEDAIWNRGEDW